MQDSDGVMSKQTNNQSINQSIRITSEKIR